jgi:60 kDa SS-A/Ro ribonucleoprotein
MARMNMAVRTPPPRTHEGAPAARIDLEAQLRRSVMACLLWEDTFYESGQSIGNRIAETATQLPPEVVAGIAIEAREQMYLRRAPLWLVRAMAPHGGRIVGDTLARVIQRADELAEFLALYWADGRTPLSKQVKRGLALAFQKFDAYHLAKYDRDGAVKLRDVLFMVHPTPKDAAQQVAWDQLAAGTLPAPETWEVLLSAGNDKLAVWTHLLLDRKLGGLALLRNLRNMEQAGVDRDVIREAIRENAFNKVLPFRFLAAAKHAPSLEDVLEEAMFRATASLDKLPGKTALLVDHSGSMRGAPVSAKSELDRFDAAAALAVLLREVCDDVDVIAFSGEAWLLPPRRGFALISALQQGYFGGTYTEDAKRVADARGYDRIVVVTDEQSHQALSAPNGRGYVVNIACYRNGIGYGPWTHIDGWSENVVRFIHAAERH